MQLDHAVENTIDSKETFLCTHTRGYFYQGLGTGQKVYYNLDDSLEVLNLSTLALGHMTARQIIESGTNNFWNDMWIPSPDVLRLRNTSITSFDTPIMVTSETGQTILVNPNFISIDGVKYKVDRNHGVLRLSGSLLIVWKRISVKKCFSYHTAFESMNTYNTRLSDDLSKAKV